MEDKVLEKIQDGNQEIKPQENINPLDLIKLWDEVFNVYSFNNPEYSRACLHLTLGSLLKNHRIKRNGINTDPRISILYLKPTFSGGSAGYDMIAEIFRKIDLKPQKITDNSDASLVGTLLRDKESGGYDEIKGILDKTISDLVYWGEGSILFQKHLPPYQVKTRNFIQMGLNPIDSEESHFEKSLIGGIIKCDCEFSLMCVSFPPKELDDEVLYTGFIHRFCFIPKTIDIDGRIKNTMDDIERYNGSEDVNSRLEKIIKILKFLKDRYKDKTIFQIDDEGLKYFKSIETELLTKFKNTNERIQTHMGSIIASTVRKIAAISLHHCILRLDTKITKDDIEYSFKEVINPQLEMIHEYLESKSENQLWNNYQDDEIKKIMNSCSIKGITKNTKIEKKDFLKLIGESLKITSSRSIHNNPNHITGSYSYLAFFTINRLHSHYF